MPKLSHVLIYILIISLINGARILVVVPMPSLSHQVAFRPVTQELVKRGHQVVVITPDPAFPEGGAPENLTEINVHDEGYKTWKTVLARELARNSDDPLAQAKGLLKSGQYIFTAEMDTEPVKEIIQKKKGDFDLLITEACFRPALGFSHIFKVPLIQMSSFGAIAFNDDFLGSAFHPLLYPIPWNQRIYNLTMSEKIKELWNYWDLRSDYFSWEEEENLVLQKLFGSDIPPLSELKNNIHMLMLNIHPIWIDNQPVPPSVVLMGGIHQKPAKHLPKELQTYLDSSKAGVIYVSFGTNVVPSALPPPVIDGLLEVLSELSYDILLKWDKDLPQQYKNIKVAKWLPQSDILRHPNIKLFITQGGLQSVDEAVTAGVPMIGIPVFGDQWYNSEKFELHGIGIKITLESFTKELLNSSISTIIDDDSYRTNVLRLRAIVSDQPQSPLQRAVWWIEHVLRRGGGRHLRSPAANMTAYQYFEMDLVIYLTSIALVVAAVAMVLVFVAWRFARNMFKYEKVKSL